jgi:hypothetical protein
MNSIPSLDVVIGMVIVFLTVSLVCSSMNELLAAALELRASTLDGALDSLLGSSLAKAVINHPAIPSESNGAEKKTPPYIQPALFASALLDCILPVPSSDGASLAAGAPPAAAPSKQFVGAHAAISSPQGLLENSPATRSLRAFVRDAHGDYTKLQAQIADWYNAYMDRVGADTNDVVRSSSLSSRSS